MKQVLHIFQKDLRHCWRECAASLMLLLLFAWSDIKQWSFGQFTYGLGRSLATQLAPQLLVFSWWFLMTRVIQDESLVGDRQFWVTRPYEWKRLLAAKILFVLTFINLPLFIVQISLLIMAGFPVSPAIPGLLYMQLLTSFAFLLTVAALAVVTRTVVQVVLAVIAVLVCMVALSTLASAIPNSAFGSGSEFLLIVVVVGVALAVIVWQYARRKVVFARWMIAGAVVVIALLLVATPYRTIIDREYPALAAGRQPPVLLALHPVETPVVRDDYAPYQTDEVEIMVPLNSSGIASGSIVALNGLEAAIDSPGAQWDSHWTPYNERLFPDQTHAEIRFRVPRDLYDRIKTAPVRTRVAIAFTLFREKEGREFVVPSTHFTLPGVGICSMTLNITYSMRCLSALRQPSLLEVTTNTSTSTCPGLQTGSHLPPPGKLAHSFYGSNSAPAEFALSPIRSFDLSPVIDSYGDSTFLNHGICPGTPLTLTPIDRIERGRFDLDLGSIRLLDYHWGRNGIAAYAR